MTCPKCQGFMLVTHYEDIGQKWTGARCLNCGKIVDRTSLYNRANPAKVSGTRDGAGNRRFPRQITTGKLSAYDAMHGIGKR